MKIQIKSLFLFLIILIVFSACSITKYNNTKNHITKETTNVVADSLYLVAWDNFNDENYVEAGQFFEKSIKAGYNWSGIYLNAASAWANANNKDKTFENLNKMIKANYLDKKFVIEEFPEFYKYYDSKEWDIFNKKWDQKRNKIKKQFKKITLPKLSKEQMSQDFDTLVYTIKKISPHLKVREKSCNLNFNSVIRNIRSEIVYCDSNSDFALLIKRVLTTAQDGHTSLISLNPWASLADGESLETCASIYEYQKTYDSKWVTEENLPKIIYHKGKYFLSENYSYKSYSFPIKTELVKVNNLSPKEYIIKNIDRKRSLSWDFKNHCFYSDYFLRQNIASGKTLYLSFLRDTDTISFNVDLKLGYNRGIITKPKDGFAWYFKEKKLLYINVPIMSNGEFYYNEILKFKNTKIDKVVIDVRNNPGGGDGAWFYILNALYDVNINYTLEFARNDSSNQKIFINKKVQDVIFFSEKNNRKVPNLSMENINYNGKIYVFYNEYTFSSAGSLVNISFYSDNLVAVGTKTGRILGFGVNPEQFILPNSKIKYRIEPVLDLTNCENYQDIFHDNPEIEVDLNLDEKIILRNNKISKEFIKEKDPYMKRMLK